MANTFTRKVSSSVGTSPVTIGSYTVAAATQVTVIGLSLSNTTGSAVTVDVALSNGGSDYYITKSAPVPSGGTLVLMGGDQKLVMITGDSLKVTSSASASIDAVLSILEIT